MPITRKALRASLPDVESTQRCPALQTSVTIHRDPWGIPHIKAASEPDLFFAQGFATAQDRLWHMDFDRHQALGRWSEFAGAAGLARDRLLRAAGMGRTAQLDYAAAGQEARAMLDAYTAGVSMDALMLLRDARGVKLAFNHDAHSLDPRLVWQCPKDGRYVLQMACFKFPANSTSSFGGGTGLPYRVTITNGPFVRHGWPAGVNGG